MSLFLILFFISLFSITLMISRKLILLNKMGANNNTIIAKEFIFEVPNFKETRLFLSRNLRKYGYLLFVYIIKIYIKSLNFVKYIYKKLKVKILSKIESISSKKSKNQNNGEASNFLKKISEYKNKIKRIKSKIEEENSKN